MRITGGCFCKKIRYTATIDPKTVTICHCTDCQINSGTAYGVVVGVTNEEFILEDGKLTYFEKIADSGARRSLAFCSTCGTRITQNQRTESQDVLASELEPWISEKA